MVVESKLKNPNVELSSKEKIALNALFVQKELDKGALTLHPHNPEEWGTYLVLKALVRKGFAVVEYNDAACVNGWVAEFYEAGYYEEVA